MERTKKDETPKWRKIGGGSLRIKGRRIRANQVFTAEEHEIPSAFRKSLELVGGTLKATAKPITEEKELAPKVLFEVVKEEDGKWNVSNIDSKKPINDEPYKTKKEAEELLRTLQ